MPDPHALLLFSLASLALIAVPGPAVVYIVTRSVDQGRRAGFVSMLGVEAGALVHVAAAAVGLSAIVASSATAFSIVKYAGAAYLIFLGVRRLLAREEPDEEFRTVPVHASRRLFLEGVLVNVLNPKTALFFLAFLPTFIETDGAPVALQAMLLGAVFVAVALVSDGVWTFVAGSAGARLRRSARARQVLDRVSGVVYISLGLMAATTKR